MQQPNLRHVLRLANQIRIRTRDQIRYLHRDTSASHNGPVKRSNVTQYTQSAPININHFKALIQTPDTATRKRYRLRWDWHLRNFLMSLLPPLALLACIKLIQWRYEGEIEKYAHLLPAGGFKGIGNGGRNADESATAETDRVRNDLKTSVNTKIMERLVRLENEMEQLRSRQSAEADETRVEAGIDDVVDQTTLAKARKISKTIVRRDPE